MSTISSSTTSTTAYKVTADTTGTLSLQTGSGPTTAMYVDGSQNVGVGVTPSAWDSSRKAFQLNAGSVYNTTAGDTIGVIQNGYNDGTGWKRVAAGYASRHYQNNGAHYFDIAGTSTAGSAISFTQAMTLDASGNLLVGGTSNPKIGRAHV